MCIYDFIIIVYNITFSLLCLCVCVNICFYYLLLLLLLKRYNRGVDSLLLLSSSTLPHSLFLLSLASWYDRRTSCQASEPLTQRCLFPKLNTDNTNSGHVDFWLSETHTLEAFLVENVALETYGR